MTLKIAVQKSGRLLDDSIQLLKECGIKVDNGKDQLKAAATNFPLEIGRASCRERVSDTV